jgi:hypothetical protein
MKKYEACPQGLDWREWRKLLDLVEHHKSLGAGAAQRRPGKSPVLGHAPTHHSQGKG